VGRVASRETLVDEGWVSSVDVPARDELPVRRAPAFAELDVRGKLVRALGVAALGYHVAAVLVGGSAGPVREVLSPWFDFYANGLRMTDAWGMFGKPPMSTNVTIEADFGSGRFEEIATTHAPSRSLVDRVRDVRIRKIQSKLAEPGDRKRLGDAYLGYHCAQPRRSDGARALAVRAVEHLHELRDEEGAVVRAPSTRVVSSKACGANVPRGTR
jgi:hypothetical protein